MTISYKWLSEYLPLAVEPERLSKILTSIGLEVEKMDHYEEVKGGLKGLVIGEVLHTEQHPNADKLKLTRVNVGQGEPLQIVCGAPNVAAGQKVVVATVGTTIYPLNGEPLTMKVAKIRGVESYGMICAEDEVGLGDSHAGIMVLPSEAKVGSRAPEFFHPYEDVIYEIGLTPNRMDAMSHWGVARDVCAYLSHHDKQEVKPVIPVNDFKKDKASLDITVTVEDTAACKRYSGVCIEGVTVAESPRWLQEKLRSIGLRPINNIVDITNFILHETGQPLHAFDYDAVSGHKIIVKTLPPGTTFITLDEKERKLSSEDLMICSADAPMCIAGVFGGLKSGVKPSTKRIFLESAYFDPVSIRKTSFRHGLRTDAATRFEKGIDISNTVNVLKRAAMLVREIAGGTIASDIVDVYPDPEPKKQVAVKYQYLKKLSGKNYHPDTVTKILQSLGFSVIREGGDTLSLEVPYHKPDVSIPADIVEEILRIDGLDNIDIPATISISPSIDRNYRAEQMKERISNVLTGLGYSEILTNSITNSAYFSESVLQSSVKLLNNLSSELDVMRPSMLHTALEVIAFNINRRNHDLKLFEFGKTYAALGTGQYRETNHLSVYLTGQLHANHWNNKARATDIYYVKGVVSSLLSKLGVDVKDFEEHHSSNLRPALTGKINGETVVEFGSVLPSVTNRFDLKQTVFFVDFNWDIILANSGRQVQFKEVPKYPAVERDLAMIVPKGMKYASIKEQIGRLKLNKLQQVNLFDVFESEKLGADKKSMAINFIFQDEEKTLTDKEIDAWMNKIMTTLEKDLQAEIRK
ncbi:MAG TPA: phenylalanine--tRNA ligase subunit beta [Flavisolibacter sp.]|nr:phenylalanine--tRNA ligase subunit beta [Flavisolibacter sp.]